MKNLNQSHREKLELRWFWVMRDQKKSDSFDDKRYTGKRDFYGVLR
jgi:hypothetical protein